MPVTRSHKTSAAASSGGARVEPSDRTSTTTGTEATSATATTSTTTGTSGTTDDGSRSAATVEESGRRTPARVDNQDAKNSTMTLVPRGSVHRPASVRSKRTESRRKLLEAREELARLELKRVQAEATLAKARMELLELEEGATSDDEEPEDRSVHVQEWVESTLQEGATMAPSHAQPTAAVPTKKEEQQTPVNGDNNSSIKELADAIRVAVNASAIRGGVAPPPKYLYELPCFDGNSGEWIAFLTVYNDTESVFTPVQNMARLRIAIKGLAREAVKSLLFSNCHPSEVINSLRRRFGRPDSLVLMEMDKLKNLPKYTDNARDVCVFASHVNNAIATIRGLNKPQYLHSPDVMKVIIEKMPAVLRYRWYDFATTHGGEEDYDLTLVSKYLNQEADRCSKFGAPEVTDRIQRRPVPVRQATNAAYEDRREQKPARTNHDNGGLCPQCKGDHRLYDCKQFKEASVQQRWDITKNTGVCFRCLNSRHRKENCKRPPCKICRRWHHHMLHSEGEFRQQVKKEEDPPAKEVANVRMPVNTVTTARAYLKIIPVELYGPRGSEQVLALLDEGSTVTLLDSTVAKKIGATGPKETLAIETVGGQRITKEDSMRLQLKIRGIHQSGKRTIKEVRTVNEIRLAPQRVDRSRIEECKHLTKLIDQLYYEEERPRLLIGQDNWELIVSRAVRRGKPGQPVASLTFLGWVLHGSDSHVSKPVNFLTCAHVNETDEDLDKLIKDHFAIESLGIQPRRPSTDTEAKALVILEERSRRLSDGRFETGLLWKNDEEEMPDNRKMAENRLRSLEKKLDKDAEFKKQYGQQIQNWLDNGYAEKVPDGSVSKRTWYLPHFAVTHPTKKKIRIVLDAAAKYQGKSLNDTLLPGPDLLQSLFGVLLRFRQGPVAVVADIKEMFLQIRIRKEDRDSLRFLWRGDLRTGAPREYRMTSVIFGSASSPSTAIYIKNRNAAEHKDRYPEAAKAIERNHYMDDYLHSFTSEEEASRIAKEVKLLHHKAGFELRGWASNREGALTGLAEKADTSRTEVEIGKTEEKTLGLLWTTDEDTLSFNTRLRNTSDEILMGNEIPTKRQVTSAVMSTFDPMGLASPVLIQGKKLLQDIWRSGVGWDEEVSPKEREAFVKYTESLQLLREIRIPRCIAPTHTEGELHVFTDASETAYAAAVYWRTSDHEGRIHVTLIAGKARVSPTKIVSIPRLELQAAVLGSRLAHCISKELDLNINRTSYWSDSSTVLSWIKSDPRTFKPFVAHRLAEIEDTTNPRDWRWVPSAHNPADDATRGVPEDFTASHRWFDGPEFLRHPETEWPAPRIFKREQTSEDKTEAKCVAAVAKSTTEFATPEPSRFSKWQVLLRATARVLQFIDLCRFKQSVNAVKKAVRNDSPWKPNKRKLAKKAATEYTKIGSERRFLLLDEIHLQKAERLLIERSQEETFKEDLVRLRQARHLDRGSKLRKLDIVLEDGLLKLRGRIDAIRGIDKDYLRPLILHGDHNITKLLIQHYHERFNHGNHATVMNELRQRFWILGLRSSVRTIVHRCQWCKVHRATPQRVPTGDLPEERLRHGEAPFACTGVDYFGPMIVTVGRRHEKRWGALFTCLTTRAVHLELASSLTTDSMIMALRRMAARRGMPKVIFSDNGTNFIGANKELQEAANQLKKEDVVTKAEEIGVRWKFIPPGAPNMGGAWERLVRSVKTALSVTLKERYPKEEVLHTLLLEAEHIINSRPLTDIGDSSEEALTPNHFLIGRSCGAPRIGAFCDNDVIGRPTWKTAQRLADHFWNRWVKEYLPTLLPRKINGGATTRDLRRGDIVLIVDPTLPRNTWPRGRVIHCHPGPDGRTRIVDITTTGGVLRRPNSKVVLLVPGVAEPGTGAAHEGEDVGDERHEK